MEGEVRERDRVVVRLEGVVREGGREGEELRRELGE
jgi:hypothetical protein